MKQNAISSKYFARAYIETMKNVCIYFQTDFFHNNFSYLLIDNKKLGIFFQLFSILFVYYATTEIKKDFGNFV